MDGSAFDNLARDFAVSRRGVLKRLAAGMLAGAGSLVGVRVAGAQGCADIRERCADDSECCSGVCDLASGRCACGAGTEPCGSECVSLETYLTDSENCGSCRHRCPRAPACQLAACFDGVCGGTPDTAQIGQPCTVDGTRGVCGADGVCACPPDRPTSCGRDCVDTMSDARNCGACDNRCPRTSNGNGICSGGVCAIVCDAGYSPCGDGCCADGRECCNGECCRPNTCCSAEGCVPCRCDIGIESYDEGEINPENACQFCSPTQDHRGWTNSDDGTFCGDGRVCCNGECCSPSECCDGLQCTSIGCPDQCEIQGQPYEADERNPVNNCQYCAPERNRYDWTLVDDQVACGGVPGRVCCNGECCSPSECCNPSGFCEECGPHCRIGGEDIDAGTVNPANDCEVCNPDIALDEWSQAGDDADCGVGQYCCAGTCCPLGECCNDGACGACTCRIGGNDWADGTLNPLNHCEECDPERSRDSWSPARNRSDCGLGGNRECCGGQCCPQGECCNDIGECEACPCRIDGNDVVDGGVNPQNSCQVCDTSQSRDTWTILDDGDACGTEMDDRVCCGGACCPQGQCCVDGSCQDCGCQIGDDPIEPGTVNPDNSCQICDPGRSRLTWSPVDSGTACGPNGDQKCCGGDCCADDECCILDACGTCLCQIGETNVPAETPNPDNACEACDPERDPFGWSPVDDRMPCGDGQVCCDGTCCDPGRCCVQGICQFCGCRIGEADVAEFAINPENECQWCDPALDPFAWSPRSDEPCGDGGDHVCCGGSCCGPGMCCGLNDTCIPCPCEIDGVVYPDGTTNPSNDCQVCDYSRDGVAWSTAENNAPCGAAGDLFCCAGACCPDGECCHAADETCGTGPCQCTIGEDPVAEGEVNPQNECEHCDPAENTSGWTPLDDDSACGETGTRVCCGGSCCADGNCCTLGVCGICGCEIDGALHDEFAINPGNSCLWCDPVLDQFAWSAVADDTTCGASQVCCSGACCGPNECCGLNGACEPCDTQCAIGGQIYSAGTANPQNSCEMCDPLRSTTAWSQTPDNGICGENDNQVCCDGDCCPANWCCINGRCEIELCNDPCFRDPDSCRCEIGGVTYPNLARNPNNFCEQCSWYVSSTAWSPVGDNEPCGANEEQFCCSGSCCAAGECCTSDGACSTGGASACDGCDIGGQFYRVATTNPNNDCEICAPFFSTTSWSPRSNGNPCGEEGDRECCNGVCCGDGQCCDGTGVSATCAVCGCVIDGISYAPGEHSLLNPCVFCDPEQSSTGWTISDLEFCTFDFGRECCNGVCCQYDLCCGFSGQCEEIEFNLSNCVYWQD